MGKFLKNASFAIIMLSLFLICSCPQPVTPDEGGDEYETLDPNVVTVIEKGATVKTVNPSDKILYALITNFTSSKDYASESLKYVSSDSWDRVRSNNIYEYSLSPNANNTKSSIRSTVKDASLKSAPTIENGKVVWKNFTFNNGKYTKNYKEIYTDTTNKIIYLIDSDKYQDDSAAMVIINYLYNNEGSWTKMPSDLLATLQSKVATVNDTFPNKNYLFNKSETDKGYFFVFMDKFVDRGWSSSVGGYFSSDIYSSDVENTPYAAFYLNTCSSFTGNVDFAETELSLDDNQLLIYQIADNFVKTLAHEYTHYLESDYKHTQKYTNTSSIHFLSEGYANYIAAKGTEDTSFSKLGVYMSELLGGHKIYEPKDSDDVSYGLGHLFFAYIEGKYGADVPSKIMRDDKAVFTAVEAETGKTFGEVYNDFILNLILSGYTSGVSVNGTTYGNMNFAKYKAWDSTNGKYVDEHGFETIYSKVSRTVKQYKDKGTQDTYIKDYDTNESIYNDVKMILENNEGISSKLGEMSFRLVCYPESCPDTLTLTSSSDDVKAYLFYSAKKPLDRV